MATSVSLSIFSRSTLQALQNTSQQIGVTQNRLSTGKKVNSPIDNATAFFIAQSLTSRASDVSAAKDSIGVAVNTVKAGVDALDAVSSTLEQLKGLADQVVAGQGDAASLNTQFNELRNQLNNLVSDASFQGVNLIGGADTLKVNFNESAAAEQTITGSTNSASGLSIDSQSISTAAAASDAVTALTTALSSVRSRATVLGSNASFLQTRLDFNTKQTNNLQEGADRLTNADPNEEAANLTALQTRQPSGISSLALAAQSERSILALFS